MRDITKRTSVKISKNLSKNISKMHIVNINESISLDSWMEDQYVESALFFDSLNVVPSTHNSGAVYPLKKECCIPWLWAKCQSYSIRDQLMMGIRCFDLRLKIVRVEGKKNRYQIVHFFDSTYTFTDIMGEIHDFLDTNDGETVFVMIKPDWNTRGNWRFSDLEDLWNTISVNDRVLKVDDINKEKDGGNGGGGISLSELRFCNVRGKVLMMPDGHFYHSYNDIAGGRNGANKVNSGKDIDFIHGVKIIYPNFLNRCNNWNAGGLYDAKRRIEHFLFTEKERTVSGEESDTNHSEHNVFPLIETNVVLFKGSIPPCVVSKCMKSYLENECVRMDSSTEDDMCYVKRLGFLMLDFADDTLVKQLLTNNLCS